MDEKFINTSIASYETRIRYEKQRAIAAIADDDFAIAAMAVTEAMRLKGAIDELQFILDAMEVE